MQPRGAPAITGEWECTECGYVEEGTDARRPAKCPECGATPEALEFFPFDDEEEWEEDEDEEEEFEDLDEDEEWEEDDEDGFDGAEEDY